MQVMASATCISQLATSAFWSFKEVVAEKGMVLDSRSCRAAPIGAESAPSVSKDLRFGRHGDLPRLNRVCCFDRLQGVSKSVRALFNGITAVMVLTLMSLKQRALLKQLFIGPGVGVSLK